MKRHYYDTLFAADRYYPDVYINEGEILFLKGFFTNVYQDHTYKRGNIISLNIGVLKEYFKNSSWHALKRIHFYKEQLGLDIGINLYPKEFRIFKMQEKPDEKDKYLKQQKLIKLLKKYKTINEIVGNNELLRLIDNAEICGTHTFMYVTFNKVKKLKEQLSLYLENYIHRYETEQLHLPATKIYSREKHFELFYSLMNDLKDYDSSALAMSIDDWEEGAKKHINENCTMSQFRPIEFLLYLEKYGVLKIKDFGFKRFMHVRRYQESPWEIEIKMLRTIEEIKEIQKNWFKYGYLAFRKDKGIAINANLAKKTYQANQDAYKILCLFLGSEKKKYSFDEIENKCFTGESPNATALSAKIDNVFLNKNGLNGILRMDSPESKVAFVKNKGTVELIIIP